MVQILNLALIALSTASIITAAPTSQDDYSSIVVLTRDSNGTVSNPTDMTEKVRSEFRSGDRAWSSGTTSTLNKRSEITLQNCLNSDCTLCTTHTSTFSDNFCLSVTDTQCIIIDLLDDAHIAYWNGVECNGAISHFSDCGTSPVEFKAPGTNSIGFQVGC